MILHTLRFGDPSLSPLVILHGFLGTSDNWVTLGRRWGENHFVLIPDARNHGRSPHSNEFTYAAMAADVVETMEQHGVGRADIIGHSMGGRTAMEMAVSYPQRVDRLVVVDIAVRTYERHHDAILKALNEVPLSHITERSEVEKSLGRTIAEPAVRQFLMKNLHRRDDGMFEWKMNLPVLTHRYDEVLKGMGENSSHDGPSFFVRGSRSDYITDNDMPAIRKIFPHSTFVTLDAGHWVHADRPEEFIVTVSQFLARTKES